jgi:hypothetical protein
MFVSTLNGFCGNGLGIGSTAGVKKAEEGNIYHRIIVFPP